MNCVGKRNYRYFVGFVASIAALCMYVLICTLGFLVSNAIRRKLMPTEVVLASVILVLFTGCLGCTLSGFGVFHCSLIAKGITTNEYIKGRVGGKPNDKGCITNCHTVYCTALPNSKIDMQGPTSVETECGEMLPRGPIELDDDGEAKSLDRAPGGRRPSLSIT
ncbi:hypothetical protein AAMO2058_000634000 [Amorphochlora amoebiformis]